MWISFLARAEVGGGCWGVKNWYWSCRTKPLLILGLCAYLDRRLRRVADGWRRAPPLRPSTLAPPGSFGAVTGWPFQPLACLNKFGSQTYSQCPCGPDVSLGWGPSPSILWQTVKVRKLNVWISAFPEFLRPRRRCAGQWENSPAEGARLEAVKYPV